LTPVRAWTRRVLLGWAGKQVVADRYAMGHMQNQWQRVFDGA